jgi:hypothetical protein
MTSRRVDAVYFALVLIVPVIGYYAANRWSDDRDTGPPMDFSRPGTTLEEPFVFPNFAPKYELPTVLKAHFADDMESALVQMRSALLASSTRIRIRPPERLAWVLETTRLDE